MVPLTETVDFFLLQLGKRAPQTSAAYVKTNTDIARAWKRGTIGWQGILDANKPPLHIEVHISNFREKLMREPNSTRNTVLWQQTILSHRKILLLN